MKVQIFSDADEVAKAAAQFIASEARLSVEARGRFNLAVSGGRTPWQMLRDLANQEIPWQQMQFVQVYERIAPAGDPDRNLTHLRESLLSHAPLPPEQIYAMPVEANDLEAAAASYAKTLQQIAGSPPVLDLAHLGLGPDGHTASLIPGDKVLDVTDRDIAITGIYQGRRRMTMTYPVINRARKIMWLVSGKDKVNAFPKLRAADPSIPCGRISQAQALL